MRRITLTTALLIGTLWLTTGLAGRQEPTLEQRVKALEDLNRILSEEQRPSSTADNTLGIVVGFRSQIADHEKRLKVLEDMLGLDQSEEMR